MRITAIIPARGGSKGVPHKNVKLLNGKPLIVWTIEAALSAPEIESVIVNTDDEEIAKVSKEAGADIYMRPAEFAQDLSTDLEVFTDHLTKLKEQNKLPNLVIDLRATAPLRGSARIREGIALMTKLGDSVDSVRAVAPAGKHPFKMWNFDGTLLTPFLSEDITHMKEPYNAPRQILPSVFQNNGAMNAFWPDTVLEKGSMTGERIAGFVMEDWESINIDTPVDFLIAESIMRERLKNS
ncbi:MAG TPA: acylneuraminate cytidylyltransferase family protein [Candidatus Paceibacterota bacterium]